MMAEKLLKEEEGSGEEEGDAKSVKDKKSKKQKPPKSDSDMDGSDVEDTDDSGAEEKEEKPKKALTHKEKKALEKKKKMEAEIAKMSTKGGTGHSELDANFTVAQVQHFTNTPVNLNCSSSLFYHPGFENRRSIDKHGKCSGHQD